MQPQNSNFGPFGHVRQSQTEKPQTPISKKELNFRLSVLFETSYSGATVEEKKKSAENKMDEFFNYKIDFKKTQLAALNGNGGKRSAELQNEISFLESMFALIRGNVLWFVEEKSKIDEAAKGISSNLEEKKLEIGKALASLEQGISSLAAKGHKSLRFWKKVLATSWISKFGSVITGYGAARGLLETHIGKIVADSVSAFVQHLLPKLDMEFIREGLAAASAGILFLAVHFGGKAVKNKEARIVSESKAKLANELEAEVSKEKEGLGKINERECQLMKGIASLLSVGYDDLVKQYGYSQNGEDTELSAKVASIVNSLKSDGFNLPPFLGYAPAALANSRFVNVLNSYLQPQG